ncbi:MAG: SGNH/GDSL hydrolase family protein [Chitinophagaceae bacterium]
MQHFKQQSWAFIAALLMIVLFSCQKSGAINNTPPINRDTAITVPPPPPPQPAKQFRFLALGDSYTIGQGVDSIHRFPAQTVSILRTVGYQFQPIQYIAATGWSTAALQNAISSRNPVGPFDIVTLLIGVNDQYQGLSIDGYRIRFEDLLKRAISLAGNNQKNVYVLSIPDYSVTPFGMNSTRIRDEIDAFNRANLNITRGYPQVHYVDITPSTREALLDKTLIASDQLHPSGKEYAKWAGMLLPIIQTVLQK